MNKAIKGVVWFCGRDNIGVVHVDRTIDQGFGHDYYIGVGQGVNAQAEVDFIASWGSHFPKEAGDVLFKDKMIVCWIDHKQDT